MIKRITDKLSSRKPLLRCILLLSFLGFLLGTVFYLRMSEHYAIEGSFSENRILATSLAQYTSKVIGHAAETTEFVADAYASNRMATLRESFAQRSPLSKILVDVTIYDYAGGCVWTIRRD
mgnify:FL=1